MYLLQYLKRAKNRLLVLVTGDGGPVDFCNFVVPTVDPFFPVFSDTRRAAPAHSEVLPHR